MPPNDNFRDEYLFSFVFLLIISTNCGAKVAIIFQFATLCVAFSLQKSHFSRFFQFESCFFQWIYATFALANSFCRAHSSVGQSSGLIIRRSWDHAPLGPPTTSRTIHKKNVSSFFFATTRSFQGISAHRYTFILLISHNDSCFISIYFINLSIEQRL